MYDRSPGIRVTPTGIKNESSLLDMNVNAVNELFPNTMKCIMIIEY